MSQPLTPLTPTELKVARLVSMGCDYAVIADRLGMDRRTAAVHVYHIAGKLPNPDGLKPYVLVLLTFAHQRWIEDRHRTAQPAA